MPEPTRRDGALLGRLAFRKNRGRVHAPYMIRTVCSPRPMPNLGAKGFRVKLTNRRSPGTGSPRRVAQVQQDKDIPMLWRASDLHGFDIKATDGAIGSVDDFLFSDDDWIVRWAVIDTGNWLPSRQVLLPPNRLMLPEARRREYQPILERRARLLIRATKRSRYTFGVIHCSAPIMLVRRRRGDYGRVYFLALPRPSLPATCSRWCRNRPCTNGLPQTARARVLAVIRSSLKA